MEHLGVSGAPASPKGLRHAFAVETLQAEVPINLVQRWLGHSPLETTVRYTEAVGAEERKIARKFWRTFLDNEGRVDGSRPAV
jgi:site-specific recombinase XerD